MDPFVVSAADGDRYSFGGGEVIVKAMPERTGIGAVSVETFPAGFATPEHVHHRDSGIFYLIEGSLRITCGDLDTVAHAGATIFLPQGVAHAFRVEGTMPARWLNFQSPHGDFMRAAMAAADGDNRPPAATDGNIERVGPAPF